MAAYTLTKWAVTIKWMDGEERTHTVSVRNESPAVTADGVLYVYNDYIDAKEAIGRETVARVPLANVREWIEARV